MLLHAQFLLKKILRIVCFATALDAKESHPLLGLPRPQVPSKRKSAVLHRRARPAARLAHDMEASLTLRHSARYRITAVRKIEHPYTMRHSLPNSRWRALASKAPRPCRATPAATTKHVAADTPTCARPNQNVPTRGPVPSPPDPGRICVALQATSPMYASAAVDTASRAPHYFLLTSFLSAGQQGASH